MRLTFRAKLLIIVGATTTAFLLLILLSSLVGVRETQVLGTVEARLLPKLELGPRLEAQLERLGRSLQDAVAAQDPEDLEQTHSVKEQLLQMLSGSNAFDSTAAAAARSAIEDYYRSALDVSRRLIAGQTGEAIVEAMEAMQAKHREAAARLEQATRLDRSELSSAFANARRARAFANTVRLAISISCLVLVLALSIWLSRDVLRTVSEMSAGFARFGREDFGVPIPVRGKDELASVATQANQMAASLRLFAAERDHADWLKAGQARLSSELRGALEPAEVATRATSVLARHLDAPAGAFYAIADDGQARLLGAHALSRADQATSFAPGEGLVGQAARGGELTVVDDPPPDFLRIRSGLGEGPPRALALLPLLHAGKTRGVLELAFFKPVSEGARELLGSVGETLAIALEVAQSRAAMRELLAETRRQAERLGMQEEELRASNEELQVQQEELRQANDELAAQRHALEQHNMDLEEARARLEQKAEELATVSSYKSRFLANMSHELRTPLNSMLLLSSLLAQNDGGNLTPKQVEFCQTIHSAGSDLLKLINQVLDLAKIEAGKQEILAERVELDAVAAQVRRVFAPLAADKGVGFSVDVAADVPKEIVSDRQRIEQILTNLIGNAIKFTTSGEVRVRIQRPAPGGPVGRDDLPADRAIALVVQDTGIGISPEHQQMIFAPFEQIEARTDRRYGGSGLGLTIARELATLLGGELLLESAPGKGSTFTCYLPETAPKDALHGAEPPRAAPSRARSVLVDDRGSLDQAGTHLLVIEDDGIFAEQLADIIHGQGFKVLIATAGEEGLRLARERRPRGIILDVKLPDIDGWTIMERLRGDPRTSQIPVHIISAVDAPERGLALGAVGYLTKPVSRRDLTGVVQALAPQAVERERHILVVEDDVARGESLIKLLQDEGLAARHVTSAATAVEALRHEKFACIILDLGLPDMDGLGLLEALKGRSDLDTPPVVVYTGRALTREETRRIEAYAETVILKEGRSAERLIEEIRLFVQHLRQGRPRDRLTGADRLHPSELRLEGKKVLVVDDDMRTVYALSALLQSKGVQVVTADTGRAGLEALDRHADVSCVLMDIMMPEMDGYEAMRRIRGDGRRATLPVIALTAKAMKGERERCLEAGASDYLTKPLDAEKLLATLHRWLDQQRQS